MGIEQLRCTYCGGLLIDHGSYCICDSCRTKTQKAVIDNLSEQDVFDLNTARQLKESYCFQEAQIAYDEILQRNPACEEAAWGAFLSEYGIEYQKQENKPTFHSLTEKPVYQSRYFYRLSQEHQTEALNVIETKRIEVIQMVEKLPSYDVFLSLKINDATGQKTPEYDWAMQLYYDLREEGYRVFFSPQVLKETNEDWEPYIYKAIQTCRIMLILSTSPENINAPWVRNEWRRMLSRIQNTPMGTEKPTYRVVALDMNCVPPQLTGKQAILRSDIHFSSLILSAVEQACHKTDSGKKSNDSNRTTEENTESYTEKKASHQQTEPDVIKNVQQYLSYMRDKAFIVSPDERVGIIHELTRNRSRFPENALEFTLLIKRIQTNDFDSKYSDYFTEQEYRYILSKAESDDQLKQNEDFKALKYSGIKALYTEPTGDRKNKWIAFFLCLFLGAWGAHRFYEGKYFTGVLYVLTLGFLGIGVFIDLIRILIKPNPYYV